MFPYPSGRIHMGHVRNYTMGDVIARFRRAQGYQRAASDGLGRVRPAGRECGARQGRQPARLDLRQYRRDARAAEADGPVDRLDRANSPPAIRTIITSSRSCSCDFYKAGFVYRSEADVNWDPVDMTVLANEQVIDGRGWRSGALVERRKLSQWFFKITAFADELLTALDTLDRWPEKVRADAEELDRPQRRPALPVHSVERRKAGCLHHAARHAVRRQLRGAVAGSSADAGTGEEAIPSSPPSSPNAARSAPPKPRSRRPRSWATTPASPPRIRSIRTGSCR